VHPLFLLQILAVGQGKNGEPILQIMQADADGGGRLVDQRANVAVLAHVLGAQQLDQDIDKLGSGVGQVHAQHPGRAQ